MLLSCCCWELSRTDTSMMCVFVIHLLVAKYAKEATSTSLWALNDDSKAALRPKLFKVLPSGDKNNLKEVVTRGGIYKTYYCGLFDSNCVTIVGYGKDPREGRLLDHHEYQFETNKNCWRPSWGENGYIRLEMHDEHLHHFAYAE